MSVGRPIAPLVLSDEEIKQLQSISKSRSLPHSLVQRAQNILACGAGTMNKEVAERMGIRSNTVGKCRQRYINLGIEGLHDELRLGVLAPMRTRKSPK